MLTLLTVAPKRSRSWLQALSTASRSTSDLVHQSSRFTSSNKTSSNLRADPTAKRPTHKCDPYGLSGQSLSFQECDNQLSSLDEGWKLTDANHGLAIEAPTYLEKQFYHETFYTASRFLSQISLLCTNLNHYPQLSMERVLVDDVTKYYNTQKAADLGGNSKIGIRGWVFVSTIRCSTYRPEKKKVDADVINIDRGLTYHDFHLAMSIDVEANREELGQLLLQVDDK